MLLVRPLRAILAVFSFTAVSSLPLWAAEGGEGGGLPQLDSSLFPEQVFWLIVTFGLLYLAMSFVALPRVAATKENRARTIKDELKTAQHASEAAKAMVEATEKALAEARVKAMAKIREQIAEVSADTAARQAAQERELLRNLHRAEADIAVAHEAAMQNIGASASELAVAIGEKCLSAKKRAVL